MHVVVCWYTQLYTKCTLVSCRHLSFLLDKRNCHKCVVSIVDSFYCNLLALFALSQYVELELYTPGATFEGHGCPEHVFVLGYIAGGQ